MPLVEFANLNSIAEIRNLYCFDSGNEQTPADFHSQNGMIGWIDRSSFL